MAQIVDKVGDAYGSGFSFGIGKWFTPGGIRLSAWYGASLAGIGTFINMFAKKDKIKTLGNVLAGLGMLFVGLSIMSSSMESFAQIDSFKNLFVSADNVIVLIIIGAIATAIIQSSSAISYRLKQII